MLYLNIFPTEIDVFSSESFKNHIWKTFFNSRDKSVHTCCWAAGSVKVAPVGPAAAKTGNEGALQAPEAAEQSPGGAEQNLKWVNNPEGERRTGHLEGGPWGGCDNLQWWKRIVHEEGLNKASATTLAGWQVVEVGNKLGHKNKLLLLGADQGRLMAASTVKDL
jgi:hypothetical protein